MKQLILMLCCIGISLQLTAQEIPQHISYNRIYDFLDELANDGVIDLNSAVKPYSRKFISDKLLEAQRQRWLLNKRQMRETDFFLNEYALEDECLPKAFPRSWSNDYIQVGLLQPAFHYNDRLFRARITPLLGMHIHHNSKGNITKRWFGGEFQGMIGKNISIWGSLRDNSMTSLRGNLLSRPQYLNDQPGYQYKEASYGGDYSDSRGGISLAWEGASIALMKDNISWGDNYHGSNILSGRAPSFPMLKLSLKPVEWFELNYFHGWLVSNVADSSYHYLENETTLHYRPMNKFMAANMLTFTPLKKLNISIGNAIVYAERNVQAAYFIPIAFYKSLDHTLTKGLRTENQNSTMFLNISSRNIKHLHLFASVFIDEFKTARLKAENKEANFISAKLGGRLSNFPVSNLSLTAEFTHSNIGNYKHSIPSLTWASNSYNLGHYLGDNSQEIYLALHYKPIRGLDLSLSFSDAKHGKEYEYLRRGTDWNGITGSIRTIISQESIGKPIWTNRIVGFKAVYEVFNNAYAILSVEHNNAQGHENSDAPSFGERKMTAEEALKRFTPAFWQGENTSITAGFSFGF